MVHVFLFLLSFLPIFLDILITFMKYSDVCILLISFRYENTIRGQFFGHTHTDSYMMYYDETSNFTRPVSVGYISPSVTPYGMLNPGYRIYTVDGIYNDSTFVGVFYFPLDHFHCRGNV